MRKIWCLTVVLLVFANGSKAGAAVSTTRPATRAAEAGPLTPGDHRRELVVDGRNRSYLVHVPRQYNHDRPSPVVLAFHGALMNGSMMARFTGLNRKADAANFIVVYPNGTGLGETSLFFNASLPPGPDGPPDDVAFTSRLLDDLAIVMNVDPQRIFATGLSNGGMMCHRLAAELSGRIAAIAPVGGTLALPEVHPTRPVPVIHFHGTADAIVPMGGPAGRTPATMKFRSVAETIQTWVKANGCPDRPSTTEYADVADDGTTVIRKAYGPGKGGAEVVLVEVMGGGHTWPGQRPMAPFIGRATMDVAANDLLWEFFLKHPMAQPPARALDWIRPSDDKTHFVRARTGERIVMWGFNYDRDDAGRLLEDYWADEWDTVAEDFREMKALGGNVIRIHLQLSRFMASADRPNAANLDRLRKLVRLAEESGIYLDVTGLGCYHKQDVPAWYDALEESARWDVQARFWIAVAGVCKGSPAVFCYNLMNEPILGGGDQKEDWLPGKPLGGKYYVQRLTIDPRGRTDKEIARAWVAQLAAAIRSVDDRHMITVGVIPWAQVFKGAKPLFYAPDVCGPLDFVSVHFYPKNVDVEESLAALRVYEVGKPLVIEEIFPLEAGFEKTTEFIEKSRGYVDGYISFYWGKSIEENRRKGDMAGALMAEWLELFRKLAAAGSL